MIHTEDHLNERIIFLEQMEHRLREYALRLAVRGTNIMPLDMLGIGVAKRAMSLIYGFATLLKSQNFIAAAHLVRPHLDNYLRLNAIWLVDKAQDFALKILKGERMDRLEDRAGTKLKDWYLLQQAEKDEPWMKPVYEATSGFVHLSSKHIFHAMEIDLQQKKVELFLTTIDRAVGIDAKLEGVECMIHITTCVQFLLYTMGSSREKNLEENGVFTVARVKIATVFDPAKPFTLIYEDYRSEGTVEHFLEDESHHYRINLPKRTLVITPATLRSVNDKIVWMQAVLPKEIVWEHSYVQAIGEALEKEPWWKQD
jgi:hypothetical protein